jgi:glycosyltransferase involved in cell wall biosynthesis
VSRGCDTDEEHRGLANPVVSVVLPSYNRATSLRRCIDSVFAQTFTAFELIVVDDGSTDETIPLLARIDDTRLRIVRLTANRGAAQARNAGVATARARLVAFIDSDDSWRADKLARQVEAMDAAPTVGASCTGFILERVSSGARSSRIPATSNTWFDAFLDQCAVSPGTTLMARRDILTEVGPFDPELRRFEDWDWLLRLAERYDFMVVPEPLATVYVGGYAKPEIVDEASRRLLLAQRARVIRQRGRRGLRQLQSSLMIERAVAHLAARQRVAGVTSALRALVIDPRRFMRFAQRCIVKLAERDL